jgi:hypothetical protein
MLPLRVVVRSELDRLFELEISRRRRRGGRVRFSGAGSVLVLFGEESAVVRPVNLGVEAEGGAVSNEGYELKNQ